MTEERDGVLIGRIVIEKYATNEGVSVYVDGYDGTKEELPLIDALGMLQFAIQHSWDSTVYGDDDDSDDA